MLNQPTSSPMMTRMFGLAPGAACCACATAVWTAAAELKADAAANVVPASSMLRRFNAFLLSRSSVAFMRLSSFSDHTSKSYARHDVRPAGSGGNNSVQMLGANDVRSERVTLV